MQSTTENKFWKIEQLHKILFVKKKNTAHAAQRWILSGETAAKSIGCVAGRYRNSTQRLKQKKMRATSVTALAQKITLFNINDIICELIQLVNNFFQKFKRSCYQFVSFWTFKIIYMPLHSTVYEFSELLYPTFFDGRANNFVISI